MEVVPHDVAPEHRGARFDQWLAEEDLDGRRALDVGTGTGRVALAMARRAKHVVGVDVDPYILEAAKQAGRRFGVVNVTWVQGDAETVDLRTLSDGTGFDLASARLFFSVPLMKNVTRALTPEGRFLFYALTDRHWHEAGGSRFGVGAAAIQGAAQELGRSLDLEEERTVNRFDDSAAARAHLESKGLWDKWRRDGRWDTLRRTLKGGGTLTESYWVGRLRAGP